MAQSINGLASYIAPIYAGRTGEHGRIAEHYLLPAPAGTRRDAAGTTERSLIGRVPLDRSAAAPTVGRFARNPVVSIQRSAIRKLPNTCGDRRRSEFMTDCGLCI